jgi:hypothetical protein
VTTVYFGTTATFRVEVPAVDESRTLEHDQYLYSGFYRKGSVIKLQREASDLYVGAGSLYQLTPCTQEQAQQATSVIVKVISHPEQHDFVALRSALEPADDANDDDGAITF